MATAIADLDPQPALLGPEVSGIAGTRVQNYVSAMTAGGQIDRLSGIAHHLYSGGNAALPASFTSGMHAVALDTGGKPLFQTEYGPSPVDMFNVAWLIQNAVTVEGVSSYLHWDLIWGDITSTAPQGLLSLEGGTNPARWQTPQGYRINDVYYAVRHFSKWIDVGWQRVGASTTSSVIRASAFASPDGQRLTVVLINTDLDPHAITVDSGGFAFATSAIYRTSDGGASGSAERTTALGPLPANNRVDMPARSLVTITLTP